VDISVIGAGYVGLTTAACLTELGHHVVCADNDLAKLGVLRRGDVPFYEPHLPEIVKKNYSAGNLEFAAYLRKEQLGRLHAWRNGFRLQETASPITRN